MPGFFGSPKALRYLELEGARKVMTSSIPRGYVDKKRKPAATNRDLHGSYC